MSTQPEQEKAQPGRPGEKAAWTPPRLETLPLREALTGRGNPYLDGSTFYS